jgi:hypothetical protein
MELGAEDQLQIKITIGAADAFLGLLAGLMEEEDQ